MIDYSFFLAFAMRTTVRGTTRYDIWEQMKFFIHYTTVDTGKK